MPEYQNGEESDATPEDVLSKHPELRLIHKAIDAFLEGREEKVRCPICDGNLKVEYIEAIETIWVKCDAGCTTYHQSGKFVGKR